MIFTNAVIDIYSPFSVSAVEVLRYFSWTREAQRFMLAVVLFMVLWFYLAYQRSFSTHKKVIHSHVLFMGSLLLGVFVLRLSVLIYSHIDVDESEWIAGAATLYNDPRFWYSVDGTTSGPLVIMPLAIIPWFGISLSYVSVRLFATVFYLMPAIWFVYQAMSRLFSTKIADWLIIPLAVLLATSESLVPYNGETPILFLTSVCLYLYSRFKPSLGYFFLLGISIGLLAYTKPQAIPMGIMMALVVLWRINASKIVLKWSLFFIAGGLLPSIIIAIYLVISGIWNDFFQSYIVNNLLYGSSQQGAMGNEYSMITIIQKTINYLLLLPAYAYGLFLAQLASIMAIASLFLGKNQKNNFHLVLGVSLFLTAIFCCVKPQTYFFHYQNILLIPMTFVVAATVDWFSTLAKPIWDNRHIAICACVSFWVVNGLIAGFYSALGHVGGVKLDPAKANTGVVTAAINKYAKPGEKMAIWGWNTALFVETGLLQGTRDGHTHYHMSPIKLQSYYQQRYLYDLQQNHPKVVVETFAGYSALVFGLDGRKEFAIEKYPTIANYVLKEYELKEDIAGHTRIFVRKNK